MDLEPCYISDADAGACKISRLWTWGSIDTCFLWPSWHVRSIGTFALSCIGVIGLVLVLEFLRRAGKEYDRYLLRKAAAAAADHAPPQHQHVDFKVDYSARSAGSSFDAAAAAAAAAAADDKIPMNAETPPYQAHNAAAAKDVNKPTTKMAAMAARVTERFTSFGDPANRFRPGALEQLVRALLHMMQFAIAYFLLLIATSYNGWVIICIFIGAFLGFFIFGWESVTMEGPKEGTTVCCG